METSRYALVAYAANSAGRFVETVRSELHPHLPHMSAHLTILPPRRLLGSETAARELIEEVCSQVEPFDVELGEVLSFLPHSPTVYVEVARGASKMRDLHSRLDTGVLGGAEDWAYEPHFTIVKMSTASDAQPAYDLARRHWSQYQGSRRVRVEELTFVRETPDLKWIDLATVTLGRKFASHRG